MTPSPDPTRACPRCGIRRTVRPGRAGTGLCHDCYTTVQLLGELTTWTRP